MSKRTRFGKTQPAGEYRATCICGFYVVTDLQRMDDHEQTCKQFEKSKGYSCRKCNLISAFATRDEREQHDGTDEHKRMKRQAPAQRLENNSNIQKANDNSDSIESELTRGLGN